MPSLELYHALSWLGYGTMVSSSSCLHFPSKCRFIHLFGSVSYNEITVGVISIYEGTDVVVNVRIHALAAADLLNSTVVHFNRFLFRCHYGALVLGFIAAIVTFSTHIVDTADLLISVFVPVSPL